MWMVLQFDQFEGISLCLDAEAYRCIPPGMAEESSTGRDARAVLIGLADASLEGNTEGCWKSPLYRKETFIDPPFLRPLPHFALLLPWCPCIQFSCLVILEIKPFLMSLFKKMG